ncbi:putative sodium/calcium exchanger membrane region [Dioscorea sansibarensis]
MASSSAAVLRLISITITLLLLSPSSSPLPRRHLLQSSPSSPTHCSSILSFSPSLLNYTSLHSCLFPSGSPLVLPLLALLLLAHFSLLVRAASAHFSPAVASISSRLRLSPSIAAVTLLALGNGAPDAFSSSAALRSGLPRTGLAAILSAGAFVSAFVVGSVALLAAPFSVPPGPFIRDVFFYLVAVSGLFYVYLSAEIYLWQAVGLVCFYIFFVGLVFWMDLVVEARGGKVAREDEEEVEVEVEMGLVEDAKARDFLCLNKMQDLEDGNNDSSFWGLLGKITLLWEVPVTTVLKLTIPSSSPAEWSRFYAAANVALCPVLLLYSLNSYINLNDKIVFLIPRVHFPIWSVVLFLSTCLALGYFYLEKEPPVTESAATALVAFMMSVFWISTVAGELLNCLAAIGNLMELHPAILGLTVLAWGNSVGDLVADVAVAKAGQPATAMAGCFAGPMFNMLVGLGSALVRETWNMYPGAYVLQFHISIVVAFVFLLLSLMGSLLVVTWFGFRVPRFWGFFLVGLYMLFTAISLAIAKFSG